MPDDISVKMAVEGEASFKSAISAVNAQIKAMNSEMKASVTSMAGLQSAEESAAAKTRILTQQISANEDKLSILAKQYSSAQDKLSRLDEELQRARRDHGENSEEATKAARAYNNQAKEVANLKNQMNNTNAAINTARAELKRLADTSGDTASKLEKAGSKMQSLGKSMESAGEKISKVGSSMTKYITAPTLAAGTAAVKLASDYDENLNKVEASFRDNAKEVKAWAKTATQQFGISESAALEATSLFGDMGTSMGLTTKEAATMATSLAGLAGDLSSFKNIGIDQAMTALKGIFTGETESLKTLGVVMTQTNLKAFAKDMGLVYDSMSEAEKVTLRYQYVLSKTTNAQGDYARTSDGMANSLRTLKASAENLGAAFGQEVIPSITPLINKATDAVNAFGDMTDAQKQTVIQLAATAAAAGPATKALGTLTSGLGTGLETAGKLVSALSAGNGLGAALTSTLGMGGTVGLAVAGVAALTAGVYLAVDAFYDMRDPLQQLQRNLSGVADAQERALGSDSILDLVSEYEQLRQKIQTTTMTEEEMAEAKEELANVTQELSEKTNGMVSVTQNITRATDEQVAAVKRLTQEEKERIATVMYAKLLEGAESYREELERQKHLTEQATTAYDKLDEATKNLAGDSSTAWGEISQIYNDTKAAISSGLIDPKTEDGAKALDDVLADLSDRLTELTGVPTRFKSWKQVERYMSNVDTSTKTLAKSVSNASDEYENYNNQLRESVDATNEFERAVMDMVKSGFITAEQGADILGTSVQGLGYKMQEYTRDIGTASDASDSFVDSADGVADSASDEADALDEAAQAAAEAHKEIIEIASAAIDARYSGEDLRDSYNALSAELDRLRDSGDEVAISLAEQKLHLLDIAATNDELAEGFTKMGVQSEKSLTALSQYLINAGVSADDYLSGVQSMRDGVVNAFKSIRDENAMTASDMTAVLRDNLEVQRDWGNNLAYLWQQTSDNTVRAYINYLYQQGPQYAAAVAGFANGGYDELVAQAYLWSEAGQLSSDQYAAGIWMNEYLAGDAAGDVADSALDGLDDADFRQSGKDSGKDYTKGLDSVSATHSGEALAGDSIAGIKSKYADMKTAAQMLVRGAVDIMKTVSPQFRAAGVQMGAQLVAGYQSQLAGSRSAASTMAANMVSTIRAQAAQFRAAGVMAGVQTVSGITSTATQFRSAGVTAGSYMAAGLASQISNAQKSGVALARYAATAVGSLSSAFRAAGLTSGNGFAGGVAGSAGAAKGAGYKVAKSALASMSVGGWYNVGYNMAYGVASGVYGGSYLISNAAVSAARSALYRAKAALGIHSPSRVFRDEVGLMIGEGMAEGILASQRTVANAADTLGLSAINSVNSNMALGSGAGQVRNSTYNLTPTIYVYGAEGQDVDEIAAAVEQRINDSLIRRL